MAAPSMATSLDSGNRDCDVDEVTFVEEPLDTNHECLVCLQLLREPWIVECCGHHLCKPCIDKLVRDRQGCPHCRTPRFRHMRDRNHERILLGKQVYCKYRSKGCEWQGTLREVDQHCSTRYDCQWCTKQLQCYEEEKHQQVCTVAVEVIECDLKPFGCPKKLPRMNMRQHMKDDCNQHISLMKLAYKQSSSKVDFLTNKFSVLEKERTGMEEKHQTLRTRFDQVIKQVNIIKSERAQSLQAQSQRHKYALGLSLTLGLLIGIFLQYLHPVIFVKFVLPVVILSLLFLGICACYVYLSSIFPSYAS